MILLLLLLKTNMVFHKITYNTRNFTVQSFKVHKYILNFVVTPRNFIIAKL